MIFPCVKHANKKIQIHKYTNTANDEVPERPNMWYIFEKGIAQGFQKLYFHVSNAQIQKYKYTNTQKRHLTKCLKDPTCSIFVKRGLFKDIKNYIQGWVFPVSGFFTVFYIGTSLSVSLRGWQATDKRLHQSMQCLLSTPVQCHPTYWNQIHSISELHCEYYTNVIWAKISKSGKWGKFKFCDISARFF